MSEVPIILTDSTKMILLADTASGVVIGPVELPDVDPIAFAAARAEWLQSLSADDLAALYAFRRHSRMVYKDAENAMAEAWDVWNVGGVVRSWDDGRVEMILTKMPRDFVVSLDRGA